MCNESLTLEQMRANMREFHRLQAQMNELIAKMKADNEKCWVCGEPNDGDDTGRCGLCRQGVEQ